MEDSLCRVNMLQINKSGYIWTTEKHIHRLLQLPKQACPNARPGVSTLMNINRYPESAHGEQGVTH